ncbi:MAG: hypothetical protein ACYC0C_08840 [Devosia sp.]
MADAVVTAPLRWRTALVFVGVGLLIYAGLFAISETLVYRNGHANPFFKIATADRQTYDWVILGASHAMPFDFDDTEQQIEAMTGLSLINFATQGAGPLYNRFVLEEFFEQHSAKAVLYVVDSFGFRSSLWNEDRLADAKLLRGTPLDLSIAARLGSYVAIKGADWRALLDYLTGFSKLNNRDRFAIDTWEGEVQFGRRYRPSAQAEDDRIAYLYPAESDDLDTLQRYLGELDELIGLAEANGAKVTLIKMPVPPRFYGKLPGEAEFDAALWARLEARGLRFEDYSLLLEESRFYFDSDHLGEAGVAAFLDRALKTVLTERDAQ